MKLITNKKVLFSFLFILIISCLVTPSIGYAKTDANITIGEEISNTSLYTDFQKYTLTLQRKMKIKFSVTVMAVEEQITEETDENEDYYIDYFADYKTNSIEIDIDGEYKETVIENWEINAGKTKTKTVVLDAGTYTLYIFGNNDGLEYTINTEDKSTYTKKISMVSKLNLVAGDNKKITVKSEEKGKSVGEVIWTSSNKKVATVDTSGNVKGIKQGSCVISAKTKNSNTVKCNVKINARPQFYIMEASFDINYVGGVEPYITFQNNYGKTIKYVYFNTYYYNTVDDPAYCEIKNTYYQRLKITGPIKNGVTDSYYWDAVIYNNSTGKMYIKSAEIVFMDGAKKTVSIKKSYK